MKKKIILIGLLFYGFMSNGQTLKINETKIKSLDSLFRITFPSAEPGVIFILAKNGIPIFNKAYGMSNIELNVPLNTDMKMGIGSISKQFAAISILLLQQEKKLDIKDDVRKYLPLYNTRGRSITIEQLLSHTSGIPSYTELPGFDSLYDKKVSINKLVKFFEKHELLFEPGTNWSYSNSGYVLAALIVERVTKRPFNEFVRDKIFRRLLMTESTFGESDYAIINKTAEYGANTPKGKIKMEGKYDWYWTYGAGQIISTSLDMLKWDTGLYDSSFIKPDILALAHKSFKLSDGSLANYGLGWSVEAFGNKTIIQHGGSIGGYRSQGIRIPEDKLYFLVMSNTGVTNSALISNKVLSILYEMPPLAEQKQQIQKWNEIQGIYESPNSGLRLQKNFGDILAFYTIKVDSSNKVTAQRTSTASFSLIPAGKDLLFEKSNPYMGWKLMRDEKGKVKSIAFIHHFPTSGPVRYNNKISDSIAADKKPIKTDSLSLVKFSGIYETTNGYSIFFEIRNNDLYLFDPELGVRTQLYWLEKNIFWIKELNREMKFIEDVNGKIINCSFSDGNQYITLNKVYNETK
jgi:CubicO group peptidase (beta-lactamase class C family)